MKKYSNIRISFCILIILIVLRVINTEEDYEDTNNFSSSLDSKIKEIYNFSSKEKPRIERVDDTEDSHSDDRSLSDSFDSVFVQNKSTNMEAVTKINKNRFKQFNNEKSYSKLSYSVSIQKRGSHYASGALIDKKWILSVAELFFNVRESIKLYKVRLGSFNCKQGGLLLHLKGIEVHPKYKYKLPSFDLALLRIAGTVDTQSIRPISLTMLNGNESKLKFWTTYWPRLIVQGNILPPSANERIKQNIMRISPQEIIPYKKCENILQASNVTLDDSTICMQPLISHHSRCLPDPGAPVVVDNYLWGITSGWTSTKCLKRPSPTLVTGIFAQEVRSWVDSFLYEI